MAAISSHYGKEASRVAAPSFLPPLALPFDIFRIKVYKVDAHDHREVQSAKQTSFGQWDWTRRL